MQDRLVIGIDTSEENDKMSLIVSRHYQDNKIEVIKETFDDEARAIYELLTKTESKNYFIQERKRAAKFEAENDNLKKSLYWLSRNLLN